MQEVRGVEDNGEASGTDQTAEDLRRATDALLDSAIGVLPQTGEKWIDEDKWILVRDLGTKFDDLVQSAEKEAMAGGDGAEAAGVRAERWAVARDRIAERYREATGLEWERSPD